MYVQKLHGAEVKIISRCSECPRMQADSEIVLWLQEMQLISFHLQKNEHCDVPCKIP